MRFKKIFLVAVPLVALGPAKDASASGGYFSSPQPMESPQVSGHRMILSVSKDRTTLWDQLSYVGSPESFAWVLPIKGTAQVGLSSDALFNTLEGLTEVFIRPLPYPQSQTCSPRPVCPAGGSTVPIAVPVPVYPAPPPPPPPKQAFVIAREAVGPYEMTQLSSLDGVALQAWLTDHGYVIPAEVSPILSAYAAEGFNFLAIKLAPGKGVQAMRPVRVTTMTTAESAVLPLRMVAAGAGATVPMTLWTFGDGRYLPSSLPWFTIPADKLVWDPDKNESNYESLLQDGFAMTSNKGWLLRAAEGSEDAKLRGPLCGYLAKLAPELSGYADEMGNGAQDACDDDLDALFRYESARSMTRLYAELPKEALSADLTITLHKDPLNVQRAFEVKAAADTDLVCPSYAPCAPTSPGVNGDGVSSGCACAAAGSADDATAPLGALLSLGWVMVRRRKKARRATSPSAGAAVIAAPPGSMLV
jgi:hypothetical protein